MRFSEDQLESVLNLPVADVARGVRHAELVIVQRASAAIHHVVYNFGAAHTVVQIGVAEHRMIEQVEELQAELNFGFLAEHFVVER